MTPIDIVDEYDAFPLNELEFGNNVGQQELVSASVVLQESHKADLTVTHKKEGTEQHIVPS